MLRKNNNATNRAAAFTLVELILVMIVLLTIMAFIAPTLGRSFKQRGIDQEALRLLAITEYGRDEARSQGVPTLVWIDPNSGSYGVEAVAGYPDQQIHPKQYSLPQNVHFDVTKTSAQSTTPEGYQQVIQFDPDGTPTASTATESIRIADESNNAALLTLTTDGWGYEINKEAANAPKAR